MTNTIRRWQQPLQNESLAKQVYHSIKDAIFIGDLQPGQPIREMHVARSLEVSQATVREALVQLQQMGLVVREQNRRTIVSAFTREEVKERLHLRAVLEQEAAVAAAQRANDEDLAEMERLGKVVDEAAANGQLQESVRADLAFHRNIWRLCGSATLARTLDQITTPLFAFIPALNRAGMADVAQTRSHAVLVEAIRSKDEQRIRAAIATHIEKLYDGFLESRLPSLDSLAHQSAFAPATKAAVS